MTSQYENYHIQSVLIICLAHLLAIALQNDAAVFRTQETLENGVKDIDNCVTSFEDVGIQDRSMVWNTDLMETLELENLLCNAAVTMHSAEARKVCG